MKSLKNIFFLLFLGFFTSACLDDPDCFQLNNNLIQIGFRKMFDGKPDTVILEGISALGTDSIFYPFRIINDGKINLNLNFLQQETAFSFVFPDQIKNLALGYSSKIQFVSPECGERFELNDLVVNLSDFDSIRFVSHQPGKTPHRNLDIYRCPLTHFVKFSFVQQGNLAVIKDTAIVTNVTTDFPTPIFYPFDTLTSIKLPLNPASTTTTFTFTLPTGPKTLTLSYATTPTTLFNQCGPQTLFNQLNLVSTDFANVLIVNDSLQDPSPTNVQIFQ